MLSKYGKNQYPILLLPIIISSLSEWIWPCPSCVRVKEQNEFTEGFICCQCCRINDQRIKKFGGWDGEQQKRNLYGHFLWPRLSWPIFTGTRGRGTWAPCHCHCQYLGWSDPLKTPFKCHFYTLFVFYFYYLIKCCTTKKSCLLDKDFAFSKDHRCAVISQMRLSVEGPTSAMWIPCLTAKRFALDRREFLWLKNILFTFVGVFIWL